MLILSTNHLGETLREEARAANLGSPTIVDLDTADHAESIAPVLKEALDKAQRSGTDPDAEPILLAIEDPCERQAWAEKINTLTGGTARYATLISTAATLSPRATLGEGTLVSAAAVVQPDALIGRHCLISPAATIDHECRLDDCVNIGLHATLCGNVHVAAAATIGAGATIIQGIRIGRHAVIAPGAVITHDIPDNARAEGNRPYVLKENYYKEKIKTMLTSIKTGGVESNS